MSARVAKSMPYKGIGFPHREHRSKKGRKKYAPKGTKRQINANLLRIRERKNERHHRHSVRRIIHDKKTEIKNK